MRRLCIYLTYDKQKIIDRYIAYMLQELKTCSDFLVVVSNQKEIICGADILEAYADEIFYRENFGFDAGGYKDALCDFLGWDRVLSYDELVLVNDSMFGPFKPMKDIFAEMSKKKIDFWGLSKHGERKDLKDGCYFPEHIQSFFLVIRSKMLHCSQFKDYWQNMPYYTTFHETVMRHEVRFTQKFSKLGYTFDTLADTKVNDSSNIKNNYSQYAVLSFELISKRNFPFLKKRHISLDTLESHTQESLRLAIDYIDKDTDYDVNLIWENMIRTLNMTDLQRSLHLQYIIFPEQQKAAKSNVLIAVFVKYETSIDYIMDYINGLQEVFTVKIYAQDITCFENYQGTGVEYIKLRFDEPGSLFTDFEHYDFVCVLHDADLTSDERPSFVGKSYFYHIWENLIKDKDHIGGVLKRFENEPYLGFLAPPQPNFGDYFGDYGKGWNGTFERVGELAEKWGLHCQISRGKAPFCVTENFWIRGRIFRKLRNVGVEDLSYLPYVWIFLAQDAGYYCGIVESENYASMNEVNLQHYLSLITSQIRLKYGDFENYSALKKLLLVRKLQEFCEKYSRLFVYGTGYMARQYIDLLFHIEAFIVSDGQPKPNDLNGIPVRYLSEITASDEIGIVLCLNEENQTQVIPLLREHGLVQYFCI